MGDTSISYATKTWCPIVGCPEPLVSPGCAHCWARALHEQRRKAKAAGKHIASPIYDHPFSEIHETGRWDEPMRWRKPQVVFVGSQCDLFHEQMSRPDIARVFGIMERFRLHTYLVLTKRPERIQAFFDWARDNFAGRDHPAHPAYICGYMAEEILKIAPVNGSPLERGWPPHNVLIGATACTQAEVDAALPVLARLAAAGWRTWLSLEPLLEAVDISNWIGYHPLHESDNSNRRGTGLRGCDQRGSGSGLGGEGLAGRMALEESLRADQMRQAQSREHDLGLSPGPRDGEPSARSDAGASVGLASCPRPNPAWTHDQPQEREEDRQQTGELGIGDLRRAGPARSLGARTEAEVAGRGSERHGETDGGCGEGDPTQAHGGRPSTRDCGGVWRERQDHLEDRQRRPLALDFVVVGGESGPKARPCDVAWLRSVVGQCRAAGVKAYLKQLGSRPTVDPHRVASWIAPRNPHGADPAEFPADLRVRETPW